jgi:hypothetical protein
VLAGAVALFFLNKKYSYRLFSSFFFFFNIFYSIKYGIFPPDDLTKCTLLAGGNSKSYGNYEF